MKLKLIALACTFLAVTTPASASLLYVFTGYGSARGNGSFWIPDAFQYADPYYTSISVIYGESYTPTSTTLFDSYRINNDRGGMIHPSTGLTTGYTAGYRLWIPPTPVADPLGGITVYSVGIIPPTGQYYVDPTSAFGYLTVTDIGDVPEPSAWAMMLSGFAAIGVALRSRGRRLRRSNAVAF